MKKGLILIVALAMASPVFGTHVLGGELYYEYIGNSTGVNHQYAFTLLLYRDKNGVGLGPTATVCYSSSCFNDGSTNFKRVIPSGAIRAMDGGIVPSFPRTGGCSTSWANSPSVHVYRDTLTLDGACSDWQFYWQDCCRSSLIHNLSAPSAVGTVIEAKLNNSNGPNSSPRFAINGIRYNCIGRPALQYYPVTENDGDSLVYSFGTPLSYDVVSCGKNWTPIGFHNGGTVNAPMDSNAIIKLDSITGRLSLFHNHISFNSIKIDVTEFRFNVVSQTWEQVGRVTQEGLLWLVGNCVTDFAIEALDGSDTIKSICGDSSITFKTDSRYYSESLAPDGSDFRVYDPQGSLVPVKAAVAGDAYGYGEEITLHLQDTINRNGDYYVVSDTGTDGNSILGTCGLWLNKNDSLLAHITECSGIGVKEIQVSTGIRLFPNPANEFLEVDTDFIEQYSIVIQHLDGRVVFSNKNNSGRVRIAIGDFADGLYIVKINHLGQSHSSKFMKN